MLNNDKLCQVQSNPHRSQSYVSANKTGGSGLSRRFHCLRLCFRRVVGRPAGPLDWRTGRGTAVSAADDDPMACRYRLYRAWSGQHSISVDRFRPVRPLQSAVMTLMPARSPACVQMSYRHFVSCATVYYWSVEPFRPLCHHAVSW